MSELDSKIHDVDFVFRGITNTADPRYRYAMSNALINPVLSTLNEKVVNNIEKKFKDLGISCQFISSMKTWNPSILNAISLSLDVTKSNIAEIKSMMNELGINGNLILNCQKELPQADAVNYFKSMEDTYTGTLTVLRKNQSIIKTAKEIIDGMSALKVPYFPTDKFLFGSNSWAEEGVAICQKVNEKSNTYREWNQLIVDIPGSHLINYCANEYTVPINYTENGTAKTHNVKIPDVTSDIAVLKRCQEAIKLLPEKIINMLKTYPAVNGKADANWLLANINKAVANQEIWLAEAERAKKEAEEAEKAKKEAEEAKEHGMKVFIVVGIVVFVMIMFIVIYAGISKSKSYQPMYVQEPIQPMYMQQPIAQQMQPIMVQPVVAQPQMQKQVYMDVNQPIQYPQTYM